MFLASFPVSKPASSASDSSRRSFKVASVEEVEEDNDRGRGRSDQRKPLRFFYPTVRQPVQSSPIQIAQVSARSAQPQGLVDMSIPPILSTSPPSTTYLDLTRLASASPSPSRSAGSDCECAECVERDELSSESEGENAFDEDYSDFDEDEGDLADEDEVPVQAWAKKGRSAEKTGKFISGIAVPFSKTSIPTLTFARNPRSFPKSPAFSFSSSSSPSSSGVSTLLSMPPTNAPFLVGSPSYR
ncbi:hypothetical protein [Phaffia rhodozyma]|uniref:Uncharacterized protein n=1 Tax=Phaffia rhodozyma TaxID=264483 RepID=A0A0F7ST22_PHARH|nr:hypothetical protein [Phaffia rhodozyma]